MAFCRNSVIYGTRGCVQSLFNKYQTNEPSWIFVLAVTSSTYLRAYGNYDFIFENGEILEKFFQLVRNLVELLARDERKLQVIIETALGIPLFVMRNFTIASFRLFVSSSWYKKVFRRRWNIRDFHIYVVIDEKKTTLGFILLVTLSVWHPTDENS